MRVVGEFDSRDLDVGVRKEETDGGCLNNSTTKNIECIGCQLDREFGVARKLWWKVKSGFVWRVGKTRSAGSCLSEVPAWHVTAFS